MANSTVCQSKWKPIDEPRRAKPKTYRQAPTHCLKFYEEAVIESEARNKSMQNIRIVWIFYTFQPCSCKPTHINDVTEGVADISHKPYSHTIDRVKTTSDESWILYDYIQ